MIAMKCLNESCSRRTALGELKALRHKLMTGEIRIADLDLSTIDDRPALHRGGLMAKCTVRPPFVARANIQHTARRAHAEE